MDFASRYRGKEKVGPLLGSQMGGGGGKQISVM